MAEREAVPIVIESPDGRRYQQSSLRYAASFISHLFERFTGEKKYYDYKLIRNKIDFEGGVIAAGGPLVGWTIKEFKSQEELRDYLFDLDGYPTVRRLEEKNTRITEDKKNRIIEYSLDSELPQSHPQSEGKTAGKESCKLNCKEDTSVVLSSNISQTIAPVTSSSADIDLEEVLAELEQWS